MGGATGGGVLRFGLRKNVAVAAGGFKQSDAIRTGMVPDVFQVNGCLTHSTGRPMIAAFRS